MRRRILSLCCLIFLVCVGAMPILAETRYVNSSNGKDLGEANDCRDSATPCRTLTHAIHMAKLGDKIEASGTFDAKAGTPSEQKESFPVVVNKPLTIEGKNAKIDVEGWQAIADDGLVAIVHITKDASGSVFSGFTITGEFTVGARTAGSAVNAIGILVDAHLVTIQGNTLEFTVKPSGQTTLAVTVIFLNQAVRTTVGDLACSLSDLRNCGSNTIARKSTGGIATEGIKLIRGAGNTIAFNTITDSGTSDGKGIVVERSSDNEIHGNILEAKKTKGDGIVISDSNNNQISDNVICFTEKDSSPTQCRDDDLDPKTADVHNQDAGIVLLTSRTSEETYGNQLLRNRIRGYYTGIALDDADGIYPDKAKQRNENEKQNDLPDCHPPRKEPAAKKEIFLGSFREIILEGNLLINNTFGICLKGRVFKVTKVSENSIIFLHENEMGEGGTSIIVNEEGSISLLGNEIQNDKRAISYVVIGGSKALPSASTPLSIRGNNLTNGLNEKLKGKQKCGICLGNSIRSLVEQNVIEGNPDKSTVLPKVEALDAGIVLDNVLGARLDGNLVQRYYVGIALRKGKLNELHQNTTEENVAIGISVRDTSNHILSGNTIFKNGCIGIELLGGDTNQIRFNQVTENAGDCSSGLKKLLGEDVVRGGLVLVNQSDTEVRNNEISKNNNGISVRDNSPKNTFVCNSIVANEKNGIQIISKDDQATGNRFFKNNIEKNSQFGLRNFMNTVVVAATYNWWGDVTGPSAAGNPQGQGDKILGPVEFAPWLEHPIDPETCSESDSTRF